MNAAHITRFLFVLLCCVLVLPAHGGLSNPLFEKGKRPLRRVTPAKKAARQAGKHHPLSAQQCRKCHSAIYRQWRRSRHANAFSNRHFQVALQHSPYRWCVHCHAPLPAQFAQVRHLLKDAKPMTSASSPTPAHRSKMYKSRKRRSSHRVRRRMALAQEGINCAACHLRDGVLLAARPPSKAAIEAHPIRHEPKLKRAQYCAGCHQFNFTKALTTPTHTTNTPTQNTFVEWQHSYARKHGKTCQSCHMKQGAHRFPGAHDKALLRKTITIEVRLRGARLVEALLKAQHVGHAVPTGDPFRRLRLSICADKACKTLLASATLRKSFRIQRRQWVAWKDRRIPVPTSRPTSTQKVRLPLNKAATKVFWRLSYYFAEYPHHKFLLPQEIATLIAEGQATSPAATRPISPK